MDLQVEQIETYLKNELAPLEQQSALLRQELAQLDEKSSKIKAALEVITSGQAKDKSKRVSKPCATQADVIIMIDHLLHDNGSLPTADLEDLIKEKLTMEQAKSLNGFKLRFQEALQSPKFFVNDQGEVMLARGTAIKSLVKSST